MTLTLPFLLLLAPAEPQAPATDYVELVRSAHQALEAGRLEQAEAGWRACLSERPESSTCAFHLARVAARAGRFGEARDWVARAVAWGWGDPAMLAWEPDLAPLREREQLEPLVAQAEARAAGVGPDMTVPRLVWRSAGDEPRFSPDGERLVTVRDGDAWLWDTRCGEPVAVLPGGQGGVARAAFDPGGAVVVTTHWSHAANVWDARTGRFLRALARQPSGGQELSFSADGSRVLVWGQRPNQSWILDMTSGAPLVPLVPVRNVAALSPDGSRLVTDEGVWSLEEDRWLVQSGLPGSHTDSCGFSRSGGLAWILTGCRGTLRVYAARDGSALLEVTDSAGHGPIGSVVSGGKEDRLVGVDGAGHLHCWDVRSGVSTILEDSDDGSRRWGLRLDRSGRLLGVSATHGAEVWDLERGRRLERSAEDVPSPDGSLLSGRRVESAIELEDPTSSRPLHRLQGALELGPGALQPGGRLVAVPRPDGRVDELDLESGVRRAAFIVGPRPVVASTYSADGRWRVDVGQGGKVVLWDREASGGPTLVEEAGWTLSQDSVAISRDGRRVLVCRPRQSDPWNDLQTQDNPLTLALWDREWRGIVWRARGVALAVLSDDGERVATATDKGLVQVLEAASGTTIGHELVHRATVRALCFSPDGELLATGADNGEVRIWRWREGKVQRVLDHGRDEFWGLPHWVLGVRYNSDGRRLVTTTRSRVTLWDPSSQTSLWSFDFPATDAGWLEPSLSADGGRICVCAGSWGSRLFDGEGRVLADLTRFCPQGLGLSRDGRSLIGTVNGATCGFDGASAALRWVRVEFPAQGWLRFVPELYCEGTTDALRGTHVVFEDGSAPLECYAEQLFDPRRVEAALAGVPLRRPPLPRPPRVELRLLEGETFVLEARAEDPGGIRAFRVEVDGERVEPAEVERATVLEADGLRAALTLTLQPSERGGDVTITVRAIGGNNVLSPPLREILRRP